MKAGASDTAAPETNDCHNLSSSIEPEQLEPWKNSVITQSRADRWRLSRAPCVRLGILTLAQNVQQMASERDTLALNN